MQPGDGAFQVMPWRRVEDEIREHSERPRHEYYCLGEGYLEVRLHVTVHPARRR
jgi:hypothetical protein